MVVGLILLEDDSFDDRDRSPFPNTISPDLQGYDFKN